MPNSPYDEAVRADRIEKEIIRLTERLPDTCKTDPVVEKVRVMLLQRSQVGLKKYGVGLDREDLTTEQWMDHAIEEALDLALYLTRLKEKL